MSCIYRRKNKKTYSHRFNSFCPKAYSQNKIRKVLVWHKHVKIFKYGSGSASKGHWCTVEVNHVAPSIGLMKGNTLLPKTRNQYLSLILVT